MDTKSYTFVDKSNWGNGPWQDEPDKIQFPDPATGLPCLAVRHSELGHWCGYVGVAEGHPAFEQGYNDIDSSVDDDVHGGLTFAGPCDDKNSEHGICHVPSDGEPERVWWLGFDCAHIHDMSPGTVAMMIMLKGYTPEYYLHDTYRTLEYVKAECAKLARQLSAMKEMVNDA